MLHINGGKTVKSELKDDSTQFDLFCFLQENKGKILIPVIYSRSINEYSSLQFT